MQETGPQPPGPIDTTGTGNPVVQRGTLTVQVGLDAADGAVAAAAGIGRNGLTVRVARAASAEAPRTVVTDANGVARIDSLLEGRYDISVDRPLTAAELARLSPEDREVGVFAAGTTLDFAPPGRQATLQLVAARRGSLVISEIQPWRGDQVVLAYPYATYYEVYNASDTTIYLDGVVLGLTYIGMHRGELPGQPCETVNFRERTDTSNIRLNIVYAFPGEGRTFPVSPGEARVIAQDAINHTTVGVDLSRAHFEQVGSDADTDNPTSANMVRLVGGTGVLGRGWPAGHGNAVVLLLPGAASELAVDSLRNPGGGSFVVRRVPRRFVLDVASLDSPLEDYQLVGVQPCRPFIGSVFDSEPSTLRFLPEPRGIARKSLGRTATGTEILQRTRNSARDFEIRRPLSRSLNR